MVDGTYEENIYADGEEKVTGAGEAGEEGAAGGGEGWETEDVELPPDLVRSLLNSYFTCTNSVLKRSSLKFFLNFTVHEIWSYLIRIFYLLFF